MILTFFLMTTPTLHHIVAKKQKGVCASDVHKGAGGRADGFFCSNLHLRDFPKARNGSYEEATVVWLTDRISF